MSQDGDYYEILAAQRYAALEAAENQIRVNLQANYCVGGDTVEDSQSIQQLANIRQEKAALAQLANEHAQSKIPQYRAPLTREEWEAKPVEKMTALDGLYIAQKGSRFEGQIRADDPNVVAGYYETLKRRGRGE